MNFRRWSRFFLIPPLPASALRLTLVVFTRKRGLAYSNGPDKDILTIATLMRGAVCS